MCTEGDKDKRAEEKVEDEDETKVREPKVGEASLIAHIVLDTFEHGYSPQSTEPFFFVRKALIEPYKEPSLTVEIYSAERGF